jgi:hypothetical protein
MYSSSINIITFDHTGDIVKIFIESKQKQPELAKQAQPQKHDYCRKRQLKTFCRDVHRDNIQKLMPNIYPFKINILRIPYTTHVSAYVRIHNTQHSFSRKKR